MKRTGGQILVDNLITQQVEHVFCVPGESYLAVLDALYDAKVQTTICRQEGGAAMMAEAVGKLTSRPGICFVTRGPGATNASPALHIAQQDSTPMILFIGQIDSGHVGREAFQEMDYGQVFSSFTKWVAEITDPARIPEMIARAFATAMNGRAGPVVLVLPENMLTELAECEDAPFVKALETAPAKDDLETLQSMIEEARSPVLILGGSRWSELAVQNITHFAENFNLPVVCQFRRQMLFPSQHSLFAGDLGLGMNPKLLARIKTSDLVIVAGGRMGDIPSQAYSLFEIPTPRQKFVHIHAGAEELGRVYQGALHIHATPNSFSKAASTLKPKNKRVIDDFRAEYEAWVKPVTTQGSLQMGEVMAYLSANLPKSAIITNGAGNYATWIHRFYGFKAFNTQLAPTSGSMGYGVPAAVGAKRHDPTKTVIAFAGDGCFMMNGQEFATAVQYNLNVIVIVVDNGMYGTIRMHQERDYPMRVSGTQLKNPDFAALARAYGGHGETVRETHEFAPAFERAIAANKPAILHLFLDPEVITPTTTIQAIRGKAMKQLDGHSETDPKNMLC